MAGSCDWALRMPKLQALLASEEAQILRIGGAPGIGKSTLVAFIIGYLTQAVRGDVLYFFCKGTDEKKQQPFQVLRTLVSQLLARDESLYPWFETLYQQSGQKVVESFATLHHSFLMALRNTSRPMIWIVVDALDECHKAQELASSLIAASKASKQIVKLIITSREEPELLDSLNQHSIELIISPNHVHDLVSDYVKERVSRCRQIRGTEIGFRVHTRVANGAGGLWLYARLMMDEIQRLPSLAFIERQLENIPNGLVHLYQQIFATMEKSLSPLELRLAQQVFLWVDMSTFVHVGRQSLDYDILNLVFQAENSGEEVFNSLELARQLCSPLVVLYEVGDGTFEVDFVHHTAAQFVRQCSQEGALEVPKILKPQRMKELYRGNTSVWFFQQCPRATGLLKVLHDLPSQRRYAGGRGEYFEMAYGLWDAFFLQTLPELLDSYEINEVSRLCETMANFLGTQIFLTRSSLTMLGPTRDLA
jgi:nucleoside-triphosphatase THEP1